MLKTALATMFLVGIAGAAFWYQGESGEQLPQLNTAEVARGNLEFTIDATGTVQPEEVVDVGAQVAGRIESLGTDPRDENRTIDYGSPVEVGTVLARIDDSLYRSEVDQAKAKVASMQAILDSTTAQVAEAEANVERANKDLLQLQARQYQNQRDWKRAQDLWSTSRGTISESDLDLARSNYESADAAVGVGHAAISQASAQVTFANANVAKARADLAEAEASYKRALTNLGYCTIKSPVKGVIVDRRINVGQTVVSSLNSPSLFLIAKDLKKLEVWASVNEADIGNIRSGQAVTFTVDTYPNRVFSGVVAPDQPRLNASMNQSIVTYTVVVDTDNSDGKLYPYLTADVHFQVETHNDVLLVPNAALRWRPSPEWLAAAGLDASQAQSQNAADEERSGRGKVWILENDKPQPVAVQEILSDGTFTEINAPGIDAGARVVLGEVYDATSPDTTNPFTTRIWGNRRSGQ